MLEYLISLNFIFRGTFLKRLMMKNIQWFDSLNKMTMQMSCWIDEASC